MRVTVSTTAATASTWMCPTTAPTSSRRATKPADRRSAPGALAAALAAPDRHAAARRRWCAPGQRVAISVCDITRAQPRALMLEALFAAMPGVAPAGRDHPGRHRHAPRQHARRTGAHARRRTSSPATACVNHDARDDASLAFAGRTASDVPIWLNRHWLDADVRITTGFVEPHFFAGFSGGPKMVAPGLAGLATTLVLHDARHIGHPNATWGITEGNPVHDDVRAIARLTGVTFARRRGAQPRPGDHPGVRRRAVRRARRRLRPREADGDAGGRRAVGRGGHHQLGLSARPEPVSGGEGHVGGGGHRASRRHDHLRGGVPRRHPGSRPVRPAAAASAVARGRCSRWWRRPASPNRTAGRCRCRRSSSARPG